MAEILGVRFRRAGKIYNFSPGNIKAGVGDRVIVETSRGMEIGVVAKEITRAQGGKHAQALKEVMRLATEEDLAHEAENRKLEMQAFVTCIDKIKKHKLEMKLIDCEITFDNSKMLFYFTAEGRVDFRDLVKDLASVFHTRIELRQEGVRDETKCLGGLGTCGRELCCHTYLSDFAPVSIKMAKNQNLSLNTSKISGVCGRLLCCLNYEEEVYEELNKKLPSSGDYAITADGLMGTVTSVNTLKQRVKVLVELPNDEKEIRDYHITEIRFRNRKKGAPRNMQIDFEEFNLDDEDKEVFGAAVAAAEAAAERASHLNTRKESRGSAGGNEKSKASGENGEQGSRTGNAIVDNGGETGKNRGSKASSGKNRESSGRSGKNAAGGEAGAAAKESSVRIAPGTKESAGGLSEGTVPDTQGEEEKAGAAPQGRKKRVRKLKSVKKTRPQEEAGQ